MEGKAGELRHGPRSQGIANRMLVESFSEGCDSFFSILGMLTLVAT